MRAVWRIARRELRSLFDHPIGYILLFVFIGLNDFLYFKTAYIQSVASLRPLLDLLPWMFLVFIPAVTMRALAEDQRSGVLEVILAQPITEVELLLGKYLGQLLFVWLALGLTLFIPLGLSLGADLQVGVIFAQYFGAALLAAALTAVGLWASSLSKNQVTAFIVAAAVTFLLIFLGTGVLLGSLPPILSSLAANLGVISHFDNITRGVIDLRDAVYFLTVVAVFLVLAYMVQMGRKLAPSGATLKRLRLGTALLIATLAVLNLFGRHIGGRLDLTPGNVYTLSPATRQLLGGLDDIVLLKFFASREMEPQFELRKRDIKDLLDDFRAAGDGKIRVTETDPASDTEAASEAQNLGIPPVQFNVVGQSQFNVREGYLGIAVQYADETRTIPLVQRPEDLEYRLVSFIRDLTRESEPTVGIVEDAAASQATGGGGLSTLRQALGESYQVKAVNLDTDSLNVDSVTTLVLAGSPFMLTDSVIEKVSQYLQNGGSALIMASGMQMPPQPGQPFAQPVPVVWNQILEPYGLSIRGDMVYDLVSNEQASVQSRIPGMRVFVNYPFWLRALSTRSTTVNQELETIFLPWTSQIDTSEALPGSVTPLFVTSNAGGFEEGQAMIMPQRPIEEYGQDNLQSRMVAVMVNPLAVDEAEAQAGNELAAAPPRGRLIVVGNGDFVRDNWVRNATMNVIFVLNAVDWLAQDEALISIRSKNRAPPTLVFESATLRDSVQYLNWVGIPILIIIVGAVRMWRRKQATRRVYQPLARSEAS